MTQTPQPKGRIAYPSDEQYNPDRPSLEAACGGNRVMGSLLSYFMHLAEQEAKHKGLDATCKVVSITVNRDKILQVARISEQTFITYRNAFNKLGYVKSQRYSHENTYEVHFETIEKGIASPPSRKLRGRPSKKSSSNLPEENTVTYSVIALTFIKNALTFSFNPLTFEENALTYAEKLKELEEKLKELPHLLKELEEKLKELELSHSDETSSILLSEAFFEVSKLLQTLTDSYQYSFGDFTSVPSPQNDSHLQFKSPLPVATGDTKDDDLQTEQGEGRRSFSESMAMGNAALEDPDDTVKMGAIRPPKQTESEHCANALDTTSRTPVPGTFADRAGQVHPSSHPLETQALEQTTPPVALFPPDGVAASGTQQGTPTDQDSTSSHPSDVPGQHSGQSGTSTPTGSDAAQVGQEHSDTPVETHNKKPKKPRVVPLELPTMPPVEAPWDAESIVQVAESHHGRRYPNGAKLKRDRVRDKEVEAAETLLGMNDLWTGTPDENRTKLLSIIVHLETRHENWWLDSNGHVFPHQLVDKDRIHTMWEEMERIKHRSNGHSKPQSNGHSTPPSLQGLEDLTYAPAPTIIPREYRTAAVGRR